MEYPGLEERLAQNLPNYSNGVINSGLIEIEMLSDGTAAKCIFSFSLPNELESPQRVRLALNAHCQSSHPEYFTLANEAEIVEMVITANHLDLDIDASVYNCSKVPMMASTHQYLYEVVRELGYSDGRAFTMDERRAFTLQDAIPIFDWIRDNFKYKSVHRQSVEKTIETKEGMCEHFAHMFEKLIEYAGGRAQVLGRHALNLPVRGYPYFSSVNGVFSQHQSNLLYDRDTWRVVDPTIYLTTAHNPNIPSGYETRAFDEVIQHFAFYPVERPELEFLDWTFNQHNEAFIKDSIVRGRRALEKDVPLRMHGELLDVNLQ